MTELARPDAWDAFVADNPLGSYLQQTPWARVKAVNGWTSHRLVASAPGGPIGAQVLVRRPRPLPWGFAYATRGPVAADWTEASIAAFTAEIRRGIAGVAGRVSHLRIDPEVERDGPMDADGAVRRALQANGWRRARAVQPEVTRLIDLTLDEAALWSGLRKKWRQYVNRARSLGYEVVEAEGERLAEFYAIYRETADRAGFLIRTERAYRDVWQAYRPTGQARLLFAEDREGHPQAALFLVSCGPRVVEPYGGMTARGAEDRANYLVKWEAIRSSRSRGATSYDLWGLATPGIAHFKTGFGGREVTYLGTWDLVLDPLGRAAFDVAQRGRVLVERRRHGLRRAGADLAAPADGAGE